MRSVESRISTSLDRVPSLLREMDAFVEAGVKPKRVVDLYSRAKTRGTSIAEQILIEPK